MPNYDWECQKGHNFEKITPYEESITNCPECGTSSERVWISPRSPHRQLQTPIVMWKYSDGSLGVAGGADSKTPSDAERVEIRSIGDYRKYSKQLNNQLREKDERREQRFLEGREAIEHHTRSNLAYLMGQESDPVARDIYRAALEHNSGGSRAPSFREFFSVAMEMDRSNYE